MHIAVGALWEGVCRDVELMPETDYKWVWYLIKMTLLLWSWEWPAAPAHWGLCWWTSLHNLQHRRAKPYHLPLDEVHYKGWKIRWRRVKARHKNIINGGKVEFELVLQHWRHYSVWGRMRQHFVHSNFRWCPRNGNSRYPITYFNGRAWVEKMTERSEDQMMRYLGRLRTMDETRLTKKMYVHFFTMGIM